MRYALSTGLIVIGVMLMLPSSSEAANFAALAQPTTLASLLLLGAAGFCGYLAFQLWSLVRGGQMSSTWQLFVVAFALLALVQLFSLLNAIEIASIPGWLILLFSAAMVGAFVLALTKSRKTLG